MTWDIPSPHWGSSIQRKCVLPTPVSRRKGSGWPSVPSFPAHLAAFQQKQRPRSLLFPGARPHSDKLISVACPTQVTGVTAQCKPTPSCVYTPSTTHAHTTYVCCHSRAASEHQPWLSQGATCVLSALPPHSVSSLLSLASWSSEQFWWPPAAQHSPPHQATWLSCRVLLNNVLVLLFVHLSIIYLWSSHFPPGEFRPLSLPRDGVFAVCVAEQKGGREASRRISQVTLEPRMEPPGWDCIVPNNVWDPTQPPASVLTCLTTISALTLIPLGGGPNWTSSIVDHWKPEMLQIRAPHLPPRLSPPQN